MANKDSQASAIDEAIVVAEDDSWAHAYPDVSTLLTDARTNADSGAVSFFDAAGRRLLPIRDRSGHLVELRAATETPDAAALGRRLSSVMGRVTEYIRCHPEVVASEGMTPEKVIATLPGTAGRSPREQFAEFSHRLDPHPPRPRWWQPRTIVHAHSAGIFHNALHAAGWTH